MNLKLICTIACISLLSACNLVYHSPIQQGNVITPALIDQLKPGMTPEAVHAVLGLPLMSGSMQDQRWDYVEYKLSSNYNASVKKLSILFLDGKLQEVKMG